MAVTLSNGLFFSEFLADNAGGNAFDTDGDGGANKADEFIEIQTVGGVNIDLDGVQIWSAKRGLLFEFNAGDDLGPNGTATVVGQYDGAEPDGFYDAGLPDNNSNQGFLEDGEGTRNDTLYLLDTNTGEFISFSYGQNAVLLPPPPGFTGTNDLGGETFTSGAPNGTAFRRDANGDFQEATPEPGQPSPPCFVAGTLIATNSGPRAIETLKVGDLVLTKDNGAQPIRWIGHRTLGTAELKEQPHLYPYRVQKGALGQGLPERNLFVSPLHRVLVSSNIARHMFGCDEILAPVRALAVIDGIEQVRQPKVTYYHILLDEHHVLFAEGAECESLFMGPVSLNGVSPEARAEIYAIFPELADGVFNMAPARDFVNGPKCKRMARRHVAENEVLVSNAH